MRSERRIIQLENGEFSAGDESLDTKLYTSDQIPWDEIAFPSGVIALKQYLAQREAGIERVHTELAPRLTFN